MHENIKSILGPVHVNEVLPFALAHPQEPKQYDIILLAVVSSIDFLPFNLGTDSRLGQILQRTISFSRCRCVVELPRLSARVPSNK